MVMNPYLLFRLLHVLAAIVFVGGLFARQAVRSALWRAPEIHTIEVLSQAAGRVERLPPSG
jgi:uncharacterized membrane protein